MIAPRWRKMLRDAWLHRGRTLVVVLAIAVGIAGSGAVLTKWAIVREVVDRGYAASNPASATLVLDSVDAALVQAVRALPSIADAEAARTINARARVGTGWSTLRLFVRPDFTASRIAKLIPEAGAWPPADGDLTLERSGLDISGSGVGQELWIALAGSEAVPVPVTGIARDVGQAPGWMEHQIYAFATPATVKALGGPGHLNELRVVVRDASLDHDGVRRVAFEVKALVEASGRRVASIDVPPPGEHIHEGQMDSLFVTQAAFGVLTLLLSGLLALTLVEAMLAGQVREIGVMKTLGARPGQVATMYLVFAASVGLVAAALALPVSTVAGQAYAQFNATMLNFDATGAPVPGWAILAQLAVGVLLPVVAAAVPVIRGSRMPVAGALRETGMSVDGTGRFLARVSGPARPLLLSLRNAFRRPWRLARTLLTLSMAGGILMGALHLKASIRETMEATFRAFRYDLVAGVSPSGDGTALEDAARSVPGVAGAQAWTGAVGAVVNADATWGNTFPVSAVPPDTRLLSMPIAAGRWLQDDAREIVVGGRLADVEPAFAIGSTVTLRINDVTARWTVVGIAGSTLAPAFIPRRAWTKLSGDSLANRLFVAFADTALVAQGDGRRSLHVRLGEDGLQVGSTLLAENRSSVEDHLVMVADFLAIMGWLMLVVGGLALASTMSLAVLERTREIGVLRAIGARHGAIHAIVQAEGVVIALCSWLLAIPLSVVMAQLLASSFANIFFKTPVSWMPDGRGIVGWFAVVLVVSAVACAWPALRATRVSARVALSYE